MQTTNHQAIILRHIPYSESDMVVEIFSKQRGKFSLMAKGIRKPKAKNRGALRCFSLVECEIIEPKKSGDMGKLIRMNPITTCWAEDIIQQSLLCTCSEAIGNFFSDHHPHQEIFFLWEELLAIQEISAPAVFGFYCRMFQVLGIFPSFKEDFQTHKKFSEQKKFYWEENHGISALPSQIPNTHEINLPFSLLKFFNYASHSSISSTQKISLSASQKQQIWDILWWFYGSHSKFLPRSKKILEEIL